MEDTDTENTENLDTDVDGDAPDDVRIGWRCRWFGHKWGDRIRGETRWDPDNWRCKRCLRFKAPCDNCGKVHNPRSFTVCVVTRRTG